MKIRGSKRLFYWSLVGFVIFVAGLLLAFLGFPAIVDDQIYKQTRLLNGTDQFERWRELPVSIEFKVWFFNLTNPEEVMTGGIPVVTEVGPYFYKEYRTKKNITFNEQDDTLTYLQYTHFEFDHEASGNLREDDKIITLNAGLNAVLQIAERYLPELLMELILDGTLNSIFSDTPSDTMFHEVTIRELLFDGYNFCKPDDWEGLGGIICLFASLLDIKFLRLNDDFSISFSYFEFKQDKHDGRYTVNAGIKDVSKLGLIQEWDGYTYLNTWTDSKNERFTNCNRVKGRDGTVYPPNVDKNADLDIYATEICRTGIAKFDRMSTVDGIDVQRRTLGPDTFAHPDNYPDNYCFCGKYEKDLWGNKTCLPDGFADLTQCHIAPVIASFPHFLWADKEYRNTVVGLNPNEDDHITYINIEPITGTPLEGRRRLQFNIVLRPIKGIARTAKLGYSMYPIAWVEEGVVVPKDLTDQFKTLLGTALTLVDVAKWLIVAIGALIWLYCGGKYIYKLKKHGPKVKSAQ